MCSSAIRRPSREDGNLSASGLREPCRQNERRENVAVVRNPELSKSLPAFRARAPSVHGPFIDHRKLQLVFNDVCAIEVHTYRIADGIGFAAPCPDDLTCRVMKMERFTRQRVDRYETFHE